MRAAMHLGGLVLATIGAGVALLTHGTATGCAVAIVAGAVLCAMTHRDGEHGPEGAVGHARDTRRGRREDTRGAL